jgi:hypothetical protein
LFKPFITQLKLATLKKTTYTSVFFITDFSLSLVLILKPLYITITNTNITKPLNNGIKKPLNLFFAYLTLKKHISRFCQPFPLYAQILRI